MEQFKGLIKPPFANYDVVVYFGGGLFALTFLYRYILSPLGLGFPEFSLPVSQGLLSQGISILTALFSIYVMGHLIAYVGSQFIEKLLDAVFGKVSTAIFVSSRVNSHTRNSYIRALIYDRIKGLRWRRGVWTTIVRALGHLPAFPIYIAVFVFGIFGYYETRVPRSVMHNAGTKFKESGLFNGRIGLRTRWYKPMEYYVINRNPLAVARMYNYLVISGLFRTLATIFLFALWMQLYYAVHYWMDGHWKLDPIMGYAGHFAGAIEYSITISIFCFCLFSYLKFQRRYAEEAIFAFVFEGRG